MDTYRTPLFALSIMVIGVLTLTAFTLNDSPQNTVDDSAENIALVSAYMGMQGTSLLAPDAELHIAGSETVIRGQEAIVDFLKYLYASYGVTLGVETSLTDITALSDNIFMLSYRYQGTAFSGEVYPIETMIDSFTVDIPMMSILEIEDGLIIREYLFDANIPEAVSLNYLNQ